MTEGLLYSFEGRVGICLFFAIVGLIFSASVAFLFALRNAAPLTTQVNRVTGEKRHGIGWYFLAMVSVFVGLPLLALVIVTGIEMTNRLLGESGLVPIAVAGLVLAAVLALGAKYLRKPVDHSPATPPPLPMAAPMPQPGYFLPEDLDNVQEWPR